MSEQEISRRSMIARIAAPGVLAASAAVAGEKPRRGKVLMPIGDATEMMDTLYPFFRIPEDGFQLVVAGPEARLYHGVMHEIPPDASIPWDITREQPSYHIKADIATVRGGHGGLAQVNLAFAVAGWGVAGWVGEELNQVGSVGLAVEGPADTGAVTANRLGKLRVVLPHVGLGCRGIPAGDIWSQVIGTQVNPHGAVRENDIAQDRIIGAAIPDANTGVDALSKCHPVASGHISADPGIR